MADRLRLNFGNLPLVEAAVRASFGEPIGLRFSAITEVHKRIGASFPNISEPQVYEAAPGISEEVSFGPGHISGVVFSGHPRALRATLQRRVVVVRWLTEVVSDPPEYPRFSALRDTLWEVIDAVKASFDLDSIPISVVNMSYVNFIRITDFSSVLRSYFSDQVQVKATENAEEIHKVEASWREKGIDLRFRLEKVSATIGDFTSDGCKLTTVAGKHMPETSDDAEELLEEVHDKLQRFFRDVISERARQEWQLEEVHNG